MRCLTLTQPWATLVMLGEKRVETRHVLFRHRGPLAIHASRQLDDGWLDNDFFRHALARHGITSAEQIPLGKVLGTVEVEDGCRFVDVIPFPACMPVAWHDRLGVYEEAFGDFHVGRGGLLLRNPQPFAEPIPARGMNGLWNWERP